MFYEVNEEESKRLAYPLHFEEIINKMSSEYKVDAPLIYAVIRAESGFDEEAVSYVGAVGLMQIMPSTFEWLQTYFDGEVTMDEDDLLKPEVNIRYGTAFLSYLLDRYDMETSAIAAYNAGFGAVDGWLEDKKYSSDGKTLETIPYEETSTYVERVSKNKEAYINLYFSEDGEEDL